MSESSSVESHESLIKTPQQLVTVIILAFAVPIVIIVLVAQLVTGGLRIDPDDPRMSESAVASRIKPAGEVVLAGEATAAAAAPAAPAPTVAAAPVAKQDGKTVYEKACAMCHAAGVAGAPKSGDKAAWAARIAQGKETLYEHAIKGIRGMPAKGGNPALADDEVKGAVDVLVGMAK
jgi:cytochrome c5